MEYVSIKEAREIFGKNFIGLDELQPFFSKLNKEVECVIPHITYSKNILIQSAKDYILILTIPVLSGDWAINILNLREFFGIDAYINEPCFYNQDWYLNESFILDKLPLRWSLARKNVFENTRTVLPEDILRNNETNKFPSAIFCVYTFFAYYYKYGEILWGQDFIWCNDKDFNGDRIYVGRYYDLFGKAKNGFSIHRHLSLKNCYGAFFQK